jgi:hypothetical protein
MWNLDDETRYVKVHSFAIPKAFTYADMRPGHTDGDKREYIRAKAAESFPQNIPSVKWWAFRIFVKKVGSRPFDIENVPKLIVDAFCRRQVQNDGSKYENLCLYADDTLDYVRIIEVGGMRSQEEDITKIEIFGCKQEGYEV